MGHATLRIILRALPPTIIVIVAEVLLDEAPGNKLHDWMWIVATVAAIISHVIIQEKNNGQPKNSTTKKHDPCDR